MGIPYTWTRTDDLVHPSIYRYIPVWVIIYWLVPVYTSIYQTGTAYTCIYRSKEMMVFSSLGHCFLVKSCMYTLPTYSTTHPGASSTKQSMFSPVLYELGIYMHIKVYTSIHKCTWRYILTYTLMYAQIKVTTTFHFESGLIRLATQASFQSKLEPFIAY